MPGISMHLSGVSLAKTLILDSTSFLYGNLKEETRTRFSLKTQVSDEGPSTIISSHHIEGSSTSPSTSQVGVVEWRSSAIKRPKTIVKTSSQGQTVTLNSFMKINRFGSRRYFGGIGGNDVRWHEADGAWQCMTTSKEAPRILAVLHSRIATRGTRIEVSTDGADLLNTIVLTALFVLHGEGDWKAFVNRRVPSPYSFSQPRLTVANIPHVTALKLTLSTNSFLDGLLAVGGQVMYSMRTSGNRTSISKYTWEATPRLEEFASIEWQSNSLLGKQRSTLNLNGQSHMLDEFLFSSFLGNRMRRFGLPEFLPWVQWIETPPSWVAVSHPEREPLAILDRRFFTAGSTLDVTMQGLQYLDALVLSCMFIVHYPSDWRRFQPKAPRRNTVAIPRVILVESNRPMLGRSESAPNIRLVRDEAIQSSLRHQQSTSRLSRLSGESDIPAYTPAARGLDVNYTEAGGYNDPRPDGTGATSLLSLPTDVLNLLAQNAAGVSLRNQGHIEEIFERDTHTPPPSYDPPGYESS